MGVVPVLWQTDCMAGVATTLGAGLTVIVAVAGVPGQPLALGVTVMMPATGNVPLLCAVKKGILPKPEDARPMLVVVFVQVKVVPGTFPMKVMVVVDV